MTEPPLAPSSPPVPGRGPRKAPGAPERGRGTSAAAAAPPGEPGQLALLCHHRWALPVLAALARRGGGARLVELRHDVGAAAEPVRQALAALMEWGWVERNPGYGHPLRPEFLLAGERGARLGAAARRVAEEVAAAGAEAAEVAWRKWSLAVVVAAARGAAEGGGAARFGGVAEQVAGATPRALTQALRALEKTGWVRREVRATWPPTARYGVTERGLALAAAGEAVLGAMLMACASGGEGKEGVEGAGDNPRKGEG